MTVSAYARSFFVTAALLAALGVVSGALGAHGLREVIVPGRQGTYETAVQYHFFHALGLMMVALAMDRLPGQRLLRWAGGAMLAGIVLFSGSLYVLSLGGPGGLGALTPLGGLAFIAGWLFLALAAWRGAPS